jgi:hypothetical protein
MVLLLAVGVSALHAPAPAAAAPADDTVAVDTTVGTLPDTVPTTATGDTRPDVEATSPPVPAGGDTTSAAGDRSDVSTWWWIGGGLVAVAAVVGVARSLRRRTGIEEWARSASLACDTGRAMSLVVANRLDDSAPWVRPDRWADRHDQFDALLSELTSSVPERDFPQLLADVVAADARLSVAMDQVPDGTPIEAARATLQPALDGLADALTALEREARLTVFGATLPSSRTTA